MNTIRTTQLLRTSLAGALLAAANGLASGTPNDGILNGGEMGIAGRLVSLTDCGSTVHASATTDSAGAYVLNVPPTVLDRAMVCLVKTGAGGTIGTGASIGAVALPPLTPTTVSTRIYTYMRSTNSISFQWDASARSEMNFGEVAQATLSAASAKTTPPGVAVYYLHKFTPMSTGNVAISASTPPSEWNQELYGDANCNGVLDPGELALPPSVSITAPLIGQPFCFLVSARSASGTADGTVNASTVTAVFTYAGAPGAALTQTSTVIDVTTSNSNAGLRLVKSVCNLAASTCSAESDFGSNNVTKPGDDLVYRVVFTNFSATTLDAVKVMDATPAFTTFVSASIEPLPDGLTACTKTTPANASPVDCATTQTPGGSGSVNWEFTGRLAPKKSSAVLMRVHVNN